MKIGASNRTGLGLTPQRRSFAAAGKAEGRHANLPAVIEPPQERHRPAPAFRPCSTLVAQLVAGREDMPSARALRREDPTVGAGTYRAMAALAPSPDAHKRRTI